jgi:peptide deformylase
MMAKNGLGLAANQVELDAQIFVMRPVENEAVTKPFAVINPVIMKVDSDTVLGKEGCLSHLGLLLNIRRPKTLVAKFLDIDAKECILEFSGIDARCFLHEYDHLQGIEFTDRVSKLKLDMAKKKQKKLIKEHVNG